MIKLLLSLLGFIFILSCTNPSTGTHQPVKDSLQVQRDLPSDSCVDLQDLRDDSSLECYRFTYTKHLCYYKTVVTARRKVKGFTIELVVFQYAADTKPCRILERREKESGKNCSQKKVA
jgi:hypothetical protein